MCIHYRYFTKEEDSLIGRTSFLGIDNVQTEDFGEYNCSVTNEFGIDTVIITLSRRGRLLILPESEFDRK